MEALQPVKASTVEKRLLDAQGNPTFQLVFYAVDKKGEYAGVSMYAREGRHPERFAVCTEKGPELLDCDSAARGRRPPSEGAATLAALGLAGGERRSSPGASS